MPLLGKSGTFKLGDRPVKRLGYGAMQLAGPGVFGPPKDRSAAVAVLREAVEQGVDHIDTSDFYGPHVTNQIIREALAPYPDDLVIVTKVSARRGEDGSWLPALSREDLTQAVHDNLRNLGLEQIEVVNLRSMFGIHGPAEGSIEAPLTVLADLQRQGLVKHIGLSNVTQAQIEEGRRICDIVCVQNMCNLANRADDALVDRLAADGIPYCTVLPARRLHAAAVVGTVGGRATARRHTHAGRTRMASAACAEHHADPWHLIGGPFARKPGRGRPEPPGRSSGGPRCDGAGRRSQLTGRGRRGRPSDR